MRDILSILSISKVIPVVTLVRATDAVPIARSLLAANIQVMEVTLRSDAAFEGISMIRKNVPEMKVGAGTVWSFRELERVISAGAQFSVSPGAPRDLIEPAISGRIPMLLGAQTVTEAGRLHGPLPAIKFYPAESAGGVAAVRSIGAVLPQLKICPTGGLTAKLAPVYLELDNVPCVGGSWLTPNSLVQDENWDEIEKLGRAI